MTTATYRIYASHLGEGIDADDYAARLRPALSDLYPRVEWRIEVARNVSGVGAGLQGDDPSIDRDAVEHVADRVACETP